MSEIFKVDIEIENGKVTKWEGETLGDIKPNDLKEVFENGLNRARENEELVKSLQTQLAEADDLILELYESAYGDVDSGWVVNRTCDYYDKNYERMKTAREYLKDRK